jgi:DNA-binding phage protein
MQGKRYECPCAECARQEDSLTAQWHRALNEAILHAPENTRRLVAGVAAMRIGRGGVSQVARITGLDRKTLRRGIRELREGRPPSGRLRKPG